MKDPGAQCVMTRGTVTMPVSCAANWGSQDTVRQIKKCFVDCDFQLTMKFSNNKHVF